MSHVIQWGVRIPRAEEKRREEKNCVRCKQPFFASQAYKLVCPGCSHADPRRSPSGIPGDGRLIFPNAKDGMVKISGFFQIDFDNYRNTSSADYVDDFYRLDEHVAVETDREIEWIAADVRRFGFVWAHSATEEPHKRILDDLYAVSKGGSKTLLQRINEVEPLGVYEVRETRKQYLSSFSF